MMINRLRLCVLVIAACLLSLSFADALNAAPQADNQIITLDDETPGVGVAIGLTSDAPGVIVAGLNHASVTLTNLDGTVEFYMADPRARSVELAMMAGSGDHVLTLSRLPGVPTAYVTLIAQAGITQRPMGQLVPQGALTVGQQQRAIIDTVRNEMTVPITIPDGQLATVTASFPHTPLTAQLADTNTVIATLYGGSVDSLSVTLDSGSYLMTLLNSEPQAAVATLNISSVPVDSLASLNAPQGLVMNSVPTFQNTSDVQMVASSQQECIVTVGSTPINLRSGPGTGYAVLAGGKVGSQHVVAGQNTDGTWLVLADEASSQLWMYQPLGQMTGECGQLPIYDRPYLTAPIATPPDNTGGGSTDSNDDKHHDDKHSNGPAAPPGGPDNPQGPPGGGPGAPKPPGPDPKGPGDKHKHGK